MKALLHTRLVNIRLGDFSFNPGVLTTLVTIGFLYLMVHLAQWQSGKAEYKEKLHSSIVARKDLTPITLSELPKGTDKRLFLPVRLTGKLDQTHYFLLDNVVYKSQVGYDVYSPMHLTDGTTILVNRGFVPQGESRQDLPHVGAPSGIVQVKGLLDTPPPKGFVLSSKANQSSGWPKVLQYIDIKQIDGFLNTKLFGMVVWLDPKDPNSFAGHQPELNLNSAMNSGYAFQWYAMCVALTGIYFFVNIKRNQNNERT